ncbi:hypothetical protein DSCW_44270 [Desulfosarcina widdelii]|uniref:Lipoprotein n=1 Tax=Desulfosarcina widdelii TaxID=947919 RepID=A0A5K7Z8C1_9BACT|nr:hypothetical protein [Desulfosarcina widdelii]BBO77010.1 hypothetical protein DSCW_44270 [Desulfosarcina widdelii]
MYIRSISGKLLCTCFLGILLAVFGCEGTENREKVDNTVEELAGKKDLDRYQNMKDELGEIETRQAERLKQLDSRNDDQ